MARALNEPAIRRKKGLEQEKARTRRMPERAQDNAPEDRMPQDKIRQDIVIAGGGTAGLTLALALKAGLDDDIAITIADPSGFQSKPGDLRAFAIAAGTRRMFETLGVWDKMEADAEPITSMAITDTALSEPVRPAILDFSGDLPSGEAFAHMVPDRVITPVLLDALGARGVDFQRGKITGYEPRGAFLDLETSFGPLETRLLVAADGGRSSLREKAGIAFYGWGYGQSAIVATIAHEEPHGGRAVEHFLPSGPFAILPLPDNRSSIVWTEKDADAKRLLALDPVSFLDELEKRFGLELGALTLAGPPKAYPLSLGVARRFIAERFAMIGDAAHVIHPIAGQGLNLGLADAAALAERIVDQIRLGLDPGASDILEAYERDRRFATSSMAVTTDLLNRLFSNDLGFVRAIRSAGLGIVERAPPLKRFFIGQAAGLGAGAPRLMMGEPL
jgi:2-octaprenyl-6-methoxyphenol hydroxylase